MKKYLLLLTLLSYSVAETYTFLVKPYHKEIELEAKIISEIAHASLGAEVKLFIPNISEIEKEVYAAHFTLSQTCEASNFVFVNKTVEHESLCSTSNRLFFTNNYRKLLSDKTYYGALFWNKSRPNIVFIQKRLEANRITLPQAFEPFVENF